MRTQLGDNNGFTVIEVLLALAIFAIGLLAVEQMILFSQQTDMKADMYTTADTLAGQTMEYLMSLNYTDAKLTDTNGDGVAGLNAETATTADQTGTSTSQFAVYWNVAVGATDTPMENTKTIRVLVVPKTSRISTVYKLQFIKLASG